MVGVYHHSNLNNFEIKIRNKYYSKISFFILLLLEKRYAIEDYDIEIYIMIILYLLYYLILNKSMI